MSQCFRHKFLRAEGRQSYIHVWSTAAKRAAHFEEDHTKYIQPFHVEDTICLATVSLVSMDDSCDISGCVLQGKDKRNTTKWESYANPSELLGLTKSLNHSSLNIRDHCRIQTVEQGSDIKSQKYQSPLCSEWK
jgi:hypothetical protein